MHIKWLKQIKLSLIWLDTNQKDLNSNIRVDFISTFFYTILLCQYVVAINNHPLIIFINKKTVEVSTVFLLILN